MDKDLARHVATVAFKSAVRLSDMLPLLKNHCDAAEYDALLKGIAKASASIQLEVAKKAFSQYPELEQEIEQKVAKYGKLI